MSAPGRQRPGHLDVEQHLAVGTVRVAARHVLRAVDADGRDRGTGDAQPGEVGVEVGLGEAAAELDDRDRLPGAVGAVGEPVDLAELDGV